MQDETGPHDAVPVWNPPPLPAEPAPNAAPASFDGRTPGRASAIRGGIVLGAALTLVVGVAVVMAASPSAPAAGAQPSGAQPSAGASGGPKHDDQSGGNRGPSAFRFGPFAFGFGPGNGNGNGNGKDRPDGFGGVAFGRITVTSVSGNNVSLKTDDGWTRTITVMSDTKITKGGEPATIGDIKAGDVVRLRQKRNDDGTYTVTALAIVLPKVGGVVTAVDATSITVKQRDGSTQTIHTSNTTTYHLGKADGSHADVTVGSTVVGVGDRRSDGSIDATAVTIAPDRVAGTVRSVSGDTITITGRDGKTRTVHVGSSTTIGVAGVDNAKIGDVKAGMLIAAQGKLRSDGSLDASKVRAGQPGKGNAPKVKPPRQQPNASPAPSRSTG
jgi:Domain of unknown function (DUF5666)